jgi:hypothetical protein
MTPGLTTRYKDRREWEVVASLGWYGSHGPSIVAPRRSCRLTRIKLRLDRSWRSNFRCGLGQLDHTGGRQWGVAGLVDADFSACVLPLAASVRRAC